MSSTKTAETSYKGKDGLYYASYQKMRAANIRHNNRTLKQKGLDPETIANCLPKPASTKKTPRRAAVVTPVHPTRRSRRKRGPPEFLPLQFDDLLPSPGKTRVKKRKVSSSMTALSEAERNALKAEEKWLDALEDYLVDEEGLSKPNYRSVMRQVEKLVSGIGITYHHWEEGVYFMKGRKITLNDDFNKLYDEAVDFEDEHGKDLGNGKFPRQSKRWSGAPLLYFVPFFFSLQHIVCLKVGCLDIPSRNWGISSTIAFNSSRIDQRKHKVKGAS